MRDMKHRLYMLLDASLPGDLASLRAFLAKIERTRQDSKIQCFFCFLFFFDGAFESSLISHHSASEVSWWVVALSFCTSHWKTTRRFGSLVFDEDGFGFDTKLSSGQYLSILILTFGCVVLDWCPNDLIQVSKRWWLWFLDLPWPSTNILLCVISVLGIEWFLNVVPNYGVSYVTRWRPSMMSVLRLSPMTPMAGSSSTRAYTTAKKTGDAALPSGWSSSRVIPVCCFPSCTCPLRRWPKATKLNILGSIGAIKLRASTLVTGSLDGTLRIWDVRSSTCLKVVKMPAPVSSVDFYGQFGTAGVVAAGGERSRSPSSQDTGWEIDPVCCFSTPPGNDVGRVFLISMGGVLLSTLSGHNKVGPPQRFASWTWPGLIGCARPPQGIRTLAMNSQYLVSGGYDKALVVWNWREGTRIVKFGESTRPFTWLVCDIKLIDDVFGIEIGQQTNPCAAISLFGSLFSSVQVDGVIRCFNIEAREIVSQHKVQGGGGGEVFQWVIQTGLLIEWLSSSHSLLPQVVCGWSAAGDDCHEDTNLWDGVPTGSWSVGRP